ncbi:MAG TPA: peptidoglycan-binding domain-containing protein [Anaeromyxobacter sp.]|nr:peptidoglycan-binding domain-containing protein [Anaeromyxobacter sp.]
MRPRAVAVAALLAAGCALFQRESRSGSEGGAARDRAAQPERGTPPGPSGRRGPARNGARIPASPEALLGRDDVRKMQEALSSRGLLGAHRNGELDEATQGALRRFQTQQGLAATGMPDRETLRHLGVPVEEAYGPEPGGKG